MRDRQPFRLDASALALASASGALAIDGRAIGQMFVLAESAPATAKPTTGGVAVIDVMGPLEQRAQNHMCGYADGYDAIEMRVKAALGDPAVNAIVLRIDSPGGDAAGCFEAVRRMQEAQVASGKPVFAYADEMMASAAYAVACVANAGIFTPPGGSVGSVGVLSMHTDLSKALEGGGFNVTIARSGKRKAEHNPYEALTDEARASMQDMVNGLAGQFAGIVANARGMKPKAVLALEGAVLMGEKAVEAGLANKVMSFEAVLALAEKEGRKAAKAKKMIAIASKMGLQEAATEAEILAALDNAATERAALQAERDALIASTGKASLAEAHGEIEALKANTAALTKANEDLAAEKAARAALEAKSEAAEVTAMIDAAASPAVRKVVPANRANVEAFYKAHGKAALVAMLDALVPVAPAAEAKEPAPKSDEGTGAPPALSDKKWSDMKPVERANFLQKHGPAAYAALKAGK